MPASQKNTMVGQQLCVYRNYTRIQEIKRPQTWIYGWSIPHWLEVAFGGRRSVFVWRSRGRGFLWGLLGILQRRWDLCHTWQRWVRTTSTEVRAEANTQSNSTHPKHPRTKTSFVSRKLGVFQNPWRAFGSFSASIAFRVHLVCVDFCRCSFDSLYSDKVSKSMLSFWETLIFEWNQYNQ